MRVVVCNKIVGYGSKYTLKHGKPQTIWLLINSAKVHTTNRRNIISQ